MAEQKKEEFLDEVEESELDQDELIDRENIEAEKKALIKLKNQITRKTRA